MARIRRGYLVSRFYGRAVREVQSVITTVVLTLTRSSPGSVAIVTLNADEENATVQAVLLTDEIDADQITLVSPDPDVSRVAVKLAANRLERNVPLGLSYLPLGYWALLKQYRLAETTYSTHVLLPGRDYSRRRRHVHLTHGSGPKPDTTFRSPANVLASITPQWVASQLLEYKMRPDAEVIEFMPRLEIMKRSIGDRTIIERLGLDPETKLVVWAPTYRKVRRGRDTRVSGLELTLDTPDVHGTTIRAIRDEATSSGAHFIAKVHPHDAGSFDSFGVPVFTNQKLRELELTPYELFGVADQLVTDYSSVYTERERLNFDVKLFQPDRQEFSVSDRGLRDLS